MPSPIAAPPNLPVAPTAPPAAPGAPPNLPPPHPAQAPKQPPPAGAQGAWKEALHPRGRGGKWIVSKGDGYGATGPDETTKQLQQRLKQLGFHVPIDGKFGVTTEMAVKAFQQQYGLSPSGGVDAATVELMRNPAGSEKGPAQSYAQAVAAKAASPAGQKAAAAKSKAAAAKKTAAAKKAAAATKKAAAGTRTTRGTGASTAVGPAGQIKATPATGGHFVTVNGQQQQIHAIGKNRWAQGPPPSAGAVKGLNTGVQGPGHLGQANLQQGAGMTGTPDPAVKNLQLALAGQGIKLAADGRFGPVTHAAVQQLQKQYGLAQDGIVGPETKGLLIGLASAQASTSTSTKTPSLSSIASKTKAAATKAAAKVPALPPQTAHAITKTAKPPRTGGATPMTLKSGKRIQGHTKLHHSAPADEPHLWARALEEQIIAAGWGYQPSRSIKDWRSQGEPEYDRPTVMPDLTIRDGRDVITTEDDLPEDETIFDGRAALAEAVKARKTAATPSEFVRALARERVLRQRLERPEALTEAQIDALAQPALERTRKLEESAKTAGYSVTPHPFGKPGGPGLWHHKGLGLPAYITNVAHGIQKSGRSESESIAAAISAVKRWASGLGKVSPEVRAAAAKAVAEWTALKASHGGGRTKAALKSGK